MSLIPVIFIYTQISCQFHFCEMSLLVKCHNFRNPIITAGECSLFFEVSHSPNRKQFYPQASHRCTTDEHTDVLCTDIHMCSGYD